LTAAFLALWNDHAPGREAEYDTWHTREHVPERIAAPGFRAARRYACRDHPEHRWFTLYELDDIAALATPEYRDLMANPTSWSASMRPGFRAFLRAPCLLAGDAGQGIGGALAVLRLPDDAALAALPEFAHRFGCVRARLGRRAEGLPEPAWRADAPPPVAALLLIEALDRDAAQAALRDAAARFAPGADPLAIGGAYDLAFLFPAAAEERAAHRRRGWA
jgi:hypothetical protein